MNTARLKNIFLGIIAINLTLITLIQLEIFPPKAYASETSQPINTNYGLVPLNEDGSIDVNINSSATTMNVNLAGIRGKEPSCCYSETGRAILGVCN